MVDNSLRLQALNSNNLSVMSGQNVSTENPAGSPSLRQLSSSMQQVKILPGPGIVQVKSSTKTTSGKNTAINKSKERKNRVVQ